MSFLKALESFGIGKEHWTRIERNKQARGEFNRMTKEIRYYNELECKLLAELMEAFRRMCHDVGMRPKTWNGAGKLAAFEHADHSTITALELEALLPTVTKPSYGPAPLWDGGLMQLASAAYYGGRFEVTRTGEVPGPVYEYDIGSAYPSAMRDLPCLLHGTWKRFYGKPKARSIHIGYVAFSHAKTMPLCTLPIRKQDGRLFWPRSGQGVYWSYELNAAKKAGATIRYTAGWQYQRNCECCPFDWIEHRYRQRNALGKNSRGYPIKLALNSLYGKLAQRIGNPRWGNLIWAGMITAITRAQLIEAGRQSAADILMFATDAVFSKSKLDLPVSEALGEWELKEHPRLFIVQPGLYWGASRPKTRGVPSSVFKKHIGKFERHWRAWCLSGLGASEGPPIVGVPIPLFTGLRLAHARGKPETAGVWLKETSPAAIREFSFDWSRKRSAVPHFETPLCVRSDPADGASDLVSVPHKAAISWTSFDDERLVFDDQPDPPDLSPP